MDAWEKWDFSPEAENRLSIICSKLNTEYTSKVSNEWLALLNYSRSTSNDQMEVDVRPVGPKEEEIINAIKDAIENDTVVPETIFEGIPINSLCTILMSISVALDEFRFCAFCKLIGSWSNFLLVEHSMKLGILPKLRESKEVLGCVILSLKELALRKPDHFCQNILIPLLADSNYQFSDADLFSAVFPVLSAPQKDLVILSFTKKTEFIENDWLLLYLIINDLSQNNLLLLFECVQKFSCNFTKSHVFGKFLVNFCKNFSFMGYKDVLYQVIEKHQTLLKTQALKLLECN